VRENLRLLAELSRRYEAPGLDPPAPERDDREFRAPGRVAAYLGPELEALAQEQVRALLLDTRDRLLQTVLVCQGGLNLTRVRPADCLREAVRANAAALILAHNHPSGDPTPSPEDVRFTWEIGEAGALLGIEVLDHVVVGHGGAYVSLRVRGLYTPPAGPPGPPLADGAARAPPSPAPRPPRPPRAPRPAVPRAPPTADGGPL
jgi:DNA repair protein RadC